VAAAEAGMLALWLRDDVRLVYPHLLLRHVRRRKLTVAARRRHDYLSYGYTGYAESTNADR